MANPTEQNRNHVPPPPDPREENFNALSIAGYHLTALQPELVEKTDVPTNPFIREHIRLKWRMLDFVDIYIAIPRGVKKPPVALYLYSYPEPANRFKLDSWSISTTSGGFASVGFVSYLTADRILFGQPVDQWFVSNLHDSLVATVHDVQMILNYLSSRGDLDTDHVGMFGAGSGGTIAILAAATEPRIKAIDVFEPWGDWPDWMAKSTIIPQGERAQYLKPEFLESIASLDPVHLLPKVVARGVRIQNVRTDPTVPVGAQKKIEEAAPDNSEIVQFGDYGALRSGEPGSSVFDWLHSVVAPDSKYTVDPDKSKRVKVFPAQEKSLEHTGNHP